MQVERIGTQFAIYGAWRRHCHCRKSTWEMDAVAIGSRKNFR
nr:MAG TPA: hypothetical protein [Bacteriophage sp.]